MTTAQAELLIDGTLLVGVVEAPNAGVFFVQKDGGDGRPRGVTVAIGAAMAQALSVPVRYQVFPNSGECTEAVASGAISLAFMPVDDERRKKVAFGPGYYRLESTYLVTGPSGLATLADVDGAGVRVLGIANTTTIRASGRTLTRTQPVPVRSVEEAIRMLQAGEADVLALSRDSLAPLLNTVPGSRIVEGGFQQTSVSVAVPPGRALALGWATAFLERAKADGTIRDIFDTMGLHYEAVAPPG